MACMWCDSNEVRRGHPPGGSEVSLPCGRFDCGDSSTHIATGKMALLSASGASGNLRMTLDQCSPDRVKCQAGGL